MRFIQLGGAYGYLSALVDDEDFEYLSQFSWCRGRGQKTHYAVARVNGRVQQMHRLLLTPPRGITVDHADGDGLNNTRSNIRLATSTQNQQNRSRRCDNASGYKGVWRLKRDLAKPWTAQIKLNGKAKSLGYFATPEEAAHAYNQAADSMFGEYAYLNTLQGEAA